MVVARCVVVKFGSGEDARGLTTGGLGTSVGHGSRPAGGSGGRYRVVHLVEGAVGDQEDDR